MSVKNKTSPLSEQIRDAIENSGMTRYSICKAIKLSQSTMSRFMQRKGGLSIDILDAIGTLLQMQIVTPERDQKGKGK